MSDLLPGRADDGAKLPATWTVLVCQPVGRLIDFPTPIERRVTVDGFAFEHRHGRYEPADGAALGEQTSLF